MTQIEQPVDSEHIFAVLARQARSRRSGELWTTALGAGATATTLWFQHPSLSWLAAAFTAMAAYAIWGLADRAGRANDDISSGLHDRLAPMRGVAVGIGTIATLWTLVGFLRFMLGDWVF